jgi:hypothetical protein
MNIIRVVYEYVFEPILSCPSFDMNPIRLALNMIAWFKGTSNEQTDPL